MSKSEIRKIANSFETENMSFKAGQLLVDILGQKYCGAPNFEDGGFISIALRHYIGAFSASVSNYQTYPESLLKSDIEALYLLFNEKYGAPIYDEGYQIPGMLEMGRRKMIASWTDGVKYVQIWETYLNAVAYPEVVLYEKKAYDLLMNVSKEVNSEEKKKTIDMF